MQQHFAVSGRWRTPALIVNRYAHVLPFGVCAMRCVALILVKIEGVAARQQHQLCVKQLVDIIRRLSPVPQNQNCPVMETRIENKRQPDAQPGDVASISCVTRGVADAVYGANKIRCRALARK